MGGRKGTLVIVVFAVITLGIACAYCGILLVHYIESVSSKDQNAESERGEDRAIAQEPNEEKRCLVRCMDNKTGLTGYSDEKGNLIIPCEYWYIYQVWDEEAFIACRETGETDGEGEVIRKEGVLDITGKERIPFAYSISEIGVDFFYGGGLNCGDNGMIAVGIDTEETNEEGDRVCKYGFVDRDGNIIVDFNYDGAETPIYNVLAGVKNDEKYGYVNENGEEEIVCQYLDASRFGENGLAAVAKYVSDGEGGECRKYGFINQKNEIVLPFIYDNAKPFSELGVAVVGKYTSEINEEGSRYQKIKYGLIDQTGTEIMDTKYDKISNPINHGSDYGDLIQVEKDDKYGFVNKEGKEVIPCIYSDVFLRSAKNKLIPASILQENGENLWGLIDRNGETIVPFQYKHAYFLENDKYWVQKENSVGDLFISVIDGNGNTVIPFEDEYVMCYGCSDNGLLSMVRYTGELDSEGKKIAEYGVINLNGEIVISFTEQYSYLNFITVKKSVSDME